MIGAVEAEECSVVDSEGEERWMIRKKVAFYHGGERMFVIWYEHGRLTDDPLDMFLPEMPEI